MLNLLVDFKNNSQFYIINSIAILVLWLPALFMYYSLFNYLKVKDKPKYLNKLAISLITLDIILSTIFSSISLVFVNLDIVSISTDSVIALTTLVLGYLFIAIYYFVIFIWSHYLWMIFDETKINTLSDKVSYDKITKVVNDVDSNNVYLNFLEGVRKNRKLKMNKNSATAKFFLESCGIVKINVEEISQQKFYSTQEANSKEAVYEKLNKNTKKTDPIKPENTKSVEKTEKDKKETKTEKND
ncbi:hypothetical protein SLITO_v1c08580 [Spiroplasma litorale]|uniref:Uncharacterized protein n=1 Tax=Spiroplasma litorale TaxID=216942 RepID=A0A0K1W2S1_9MOLU|nr:hypothetical protein [Spiroplasma litorale]AKX34473.1 hypothetical protein SLITO_v1c08580 [Spiroplasma litorale]